ncbi:glycoside hydrolase family 92 protein [Infundibulicybe gibba]|nr:glycoside hydrolase family 92 protein [Infundibulicybe gibba]
MTVTSWFLLLSLTISLPLINSTRRLPPPSFRVPSSSVLDHVNLLIGNGGDTPNGSGGMIPSTAPPFGMTRWVAQTHQNYVSVTPYNHTGTTIHGFQGTRQPAIWMGESAPVVVIPGMGPVKPEFAERGMLMDKDSEVISPSYYSVDVDTGLGVIQIEQTATSRVGHLRLTYGPQPGTQQYILIEATRPSIITSDPSNVTYPTGSIHIIAGDLNKFQFEICGSSSERQDFIIAPNSIKTNAAEFRGYFCARFNLSTTVEYGIVQNNTRLPFQKSATGSLLSAYVILPADIHTIDVRVGTSFISAAQASRNIDAEVPNGTSLEETAETVRTAWVDKAHLVKLEGALEEENEIFWTAMIHTLQYPSEQHEAGFYYSAYDNAIHTGESYTGYSIWDTYRAEWAWLILIAPERVSRMITSMLADYQQGGWLPMWKNVVGTHADSLIAEAVIKGITDFDTDLAWEAVWKDATVPPEGDWAVQYFDREENVDYEVRAGLSSVYDIEGKGWVADDVHSESASRTLAYAYDDYAAAKLGETLHKPSHITSYLLRRALTAPFTLYNNSTGFMEARNQDGSWAGGDRGWTEGDQWAYSFDVVHDIPGLIERRGGNETFVKTLDEHFDGGHNDHSNEPSHHIPYLYALAGAAHKTQERVREIAKANYNNTPTGLSGAWYIFSAMGFYPVNPASGEYVTILRKFHPHATVQKKLDYLSSRRKDHGASVETPIIHHDQIIGGGDIVFEMSDQIEAWGNAVVLLNLVSIVPLPQEQISRSL